MDCDYFSFVYFFGQFFGYFQRCFFENKVDDIVETKHNDAGKDTTDNIFDIIYTLFVVH